jgi:hypothetical protein
MLRQAGEIVHTIRITRPRWWRGGWIVRARHRASRAKIKKFFPFDKVRQNHKSLTPRRLLINKQLELLPSFIVTNLEIYTSFTHGNMDNNGDAENDKDPEKGSHNDEEKHDKDEETAANNNDAEKEDKDVEKSPKDEEGNNKDEENGDKGGDDDDDEDEDEDNNIKVTIEDYDFKTIQKQAQPAKQAAPLVLETNQEPIDINQLDDKPWRKPGADINDYFNYGFDETTWRIYCDKQKQMKAIVDELNVPQETFKIPVVHAAPMGQPNVMPYIDDRMSHVVMDSRNAPLAQPVVMQTHHQQHHQHQHQHHQAGGRMKGVEDDVKKYDRRHNRSSERRHNSKSRERRHSKSRERERDKDKDKDKDKERKRSRSRERRSKETKSRPRSRSREEERRSKRHKSSRHA